MPEDIEEVFDDSPDAFAFGDGPCTEVFLLPEGATGVDKQHV